MSKRTIEREHGETYSRSTFAVYEHGTYPRRSVLAGRPMRRYIDGGFATPEEALAKHPGAQILAGSTHVPVADLTRHLPEDE